MQIPKIDQIDGQMKTQLSSESTDLHEQNLTEYQMADHFAATVVLLSENQVLLTVKTYG